MMMYIENGSGLVPKRKDVRTIYSRQRLLFYLSVGRLSAVWIYIFCLVEKVRKCANGQKSDTDANELFRVIPLKRVAQHDLCAPVDATHGTPILIKLIDVERHRCYCYFMNI